MDELTTIRVALLDDSEGDRVLFGHYMAEVQGWDLQATVVASPDEFESHIAEHKIQIAFVDYRLGEIDGSEVIAKAAARFPETAFVVVTGEGDEEAATRSLRAGAIDYISKLSLQPAAAAEVIERVILEHYERRQAQVFFNNVSHGVVIYDLEGVIHDVNPGAEKLWGYSREEMVGNNWGVISSADFKHFFETMPKEELRQIMSRGIQAPMEMRSERKDGSPLFIEITTGQISGIGMQRRFAMVTDVTQRRQLALLQTQRSAVLESSSDIVALLDARANITYLNPAGHRLLDVPDGKGLSGDSMHILDFLQSYSEWVDHSNVLEFLAKDLDKPVRYELNKYNSEEIVPVSSMTTALKNEFGHIEGYTAVLRDIGRDIAYEERLKTLAYSDSLTGLPNRKAFQNFLRKTLKEEGASLALMFIDLDNFKRVNDTYGHETGDRLLMEISARLMQFEDDRHFVARLAGDEFVLVLLQPEDDSEVQDVAETILESLGKPITLLHATLLNSVSIGVARAPEHASDMSGLLRCSDVAMYSAKANGRNQYAMYSPDPMPTPGGTDPAPRIKL